jgi:hypothetical protein
MPFSEADTLFCGAAVLSRRRHSCHSREYLSQKEAIPSV